MIRASGRRAEVRHLDGRDLLDALCAKLCEEAEEVADAAEDRDKLTDELADVTEVLAALMKLRGITE
ncbi:phosphoribosyl-ATP pyrophosphohydrolase, partial [Mycobacterium sp. ITM-2017-0098]